MRIPQAKVPRTALRRRCAKRRAVSGPLTTARDMEATLNGVCAMGGTVKAERKRRAVHRAGHGTPKASRSIAVNPVPRCAFSSPFSPPSASKRRLSVTADFPSALSAFTDLLPQHGVTVETARAVCRFTSRASFKAAISGAGQHQFSVYNGLLFALPLLKKMTPPSR